MSTLVIGVVCEDHGHFAAVTRLVDAALVAGHAWLDGILEDCRRWRGLADDEPWYKYDPADANDLRPIVLDGLRIAPHGHVGGVPLKPEAGMWRRALMLLCSCKPRPDVVVLARDLDGYPERREGIDQVVANLPWPFKLPSPRPSPRSRHGSCRASSPPMPPRSSGSQISAAIYPSTPPCDPRG